MASQLLLKFLDLLHLLNLSVIAGIGNDILKSTLHVGEIFAGLIQPLLLSEHRRIITVDTLVPAIRLFLMLDAVEHAFIELVRFDVD